MKSGPCYVTAVLVLWFSTIMSAQSPGATAQPEAKSTTIVGCLVQGLPNGTADRTPSVGTTSAQDFFIRTPTVKIPTGTSVAVGEPGTTSTATIGTPAPDSFYRVAGISVEQLRKHLGHRVQLQGHLTDNLPGIESSRARTTQDKDGRATTTVETRIAIAGVLDATTITMVSATCEK